MTELTLPQYDFEDSVLAQAWKDTSPRDESDVDAAVANAASIVSFDADISAAEDFVDLIDIATNHLFYYDSSWYEDYLHRDFIQDVYNEMTSEKEDAEGSGELEEWLADKGDEYEHYKESLATSDDVQWFHEGAYGNLIPLSAEEVEGDFEDRKFDVVGAFCSCYGEL